MIIKIKKSLYFYHSIFWPVARFNILGDNLSLYSRFLALVCAHYSAVVVLWFGNPYVLGFPYCLR